MLESNKINGNISEVKDGMSRSQLYGLLIILLIALLLRMVGIQNDFPSPDEQLHIRLSMGVAGGRFDVGWFGYPSLVYYFGALILGLKYIFAFAFQGIHSPSEFGQSYMIDPTSVTIWLHCATALVNVAAAYVIYLTGRALRDVSTGLMAAFLVAILPGPVSQASVFWPEGIILLPAAMCIYFCILYWRSGGSRYILMAALFAGITTSAKYNAVFLCMVVVIFYFWRKDGVEKTSWQKHFSKMLLLACMSTLGFFMTSPGLLFDKNRQTLIDFLNSRKNDVRFGWEKDHYLEGANYFDWWWNAFNHIAPAILLLLLLAAVIFMLKKRELVLPFFLSILIPVTLLSFSSAMSEWYHLIPVVPIIVLIIAFAFRLAFDVPHRWGKLAVAMFFVSWSIDCLMVTKFDIDIRKLPDSRILSRLWIEQNIPEGSRIAMDRAYVPVLVRTTNQVQADLKSAKLSGSQFKVKALEVEAGIDTHHSRYWIDYLQVPLAKSEESVGFGSSQPLKVENLPSASRLKEWGVSHIILSESIYGNFFTPDNDFPLLKQYYSELLKFGHIEFDSRAVSAVRGPRIIVLRI
jgi:hypothetical protein